MKVEPKQEFVPVIITLENQEEVDALFAIGNDTRICHALPALDCLYGYLKPFITDDIAYDAVEVLDHLITGK